MWHVLHPRSMPAVGDRERFHERNLSSAPAHEWLTMPNLVMPLLRSSSFQPTADSTYLALFIFAILYQSGKEAKGFKYDHSGDQYGSDSPYFCDWVRICFFLKKGVRTKLSGGSERQPSFRPLRIIVSELCVLYLSKHLTCALACDDVMHQRHYAEEFVNPLANAGGNTTDEFINPLATARTVNGPAFSEA